jgi:hypothetical protein
LQSFNIKSVSDKIFALYYLKNHHPILGYFVIFYILEIILLEIFLLGVVDIVLIIIFMLEVFLVYRHIFIPLKTDDREDYIDVVIKRIFSTMTYDEYQQIKNDFYKPQPFWKLYLTELLVFFFAVWTIQF